MATSTHTREEWTSFADGLEPSAGAVIDGEPADAASGATFASINPATGRTIAAVAAGDAEDIDRAVRSGRAAFASGEWAEAAPVDRKATLLRLGELISDHGDELALLDSLDMGKPVEDAATVDVPGAAGLFQWYGEAIDKLYDEVAPTGPGDLALVTREPLGVVGAVVPWNFPLDLAAWKVAPALAAGNSVVLKPAEQSPLSAIRLGELALEAGVPPGVLNVVPGHGETAGRALGLHPDVDCIAFTGSTEVGRLFLSYSAESNAKPVWLECGGKSPNLVFADADDLDAAADMAAFGIFYNQGEVCSANSRLLVERSIHDELVAKLAERARATAVGDPLDPATKMGPLVDEGHAERGDGLRRRRARGRGARDRRRAVRPQRLRRDVRRADDLRSGPERCPARPRGGVRAGALGPRLRGRGRGAADREREPLRPRGLGLDLEPRSRPPARPPASGRHGLREHGRRPQPPDPVRRLQGLGLRARPVAARA